MPSDFACRFNHLLHTEPFAIPKIVNAALLIDRLHRQNMCLGQIRHVNVISHARTIRRCIIFAENRHRLTLPQRHLQHNRYQMQLRMMIFSPFFRRPRCIEVP